jgi:hypothetical protein
LFRPLDNHRGDTYHISRSSMALSWPRKLLESFGSLIVCVLYEIVYSGLTYVDWTIVCCWMERTWSSTVIRCVTWATSPTISQ